MGSVTKCPVSGRSIGAWYSKFTCNLLYFHGVSLFKDSGCKIWYCNDLARITNKQQTNIYLRRFAECLIYFCTTQAPSETSSKVIKPYRVLYTAHLIGKKSAAQELTIMTFLRTLNPFASFQSDQICLIILSRFIAWKHLCLFLPTRHCNSNLPDFLFVVFAPHLIPITLRNPI